MLSINKSLSLKQDRADCRIFVIIAAAGSSQRFGGAIPKQFSVVNGVSPVRKTVDLFLECHFISGIVCVIPDGYIGTYTRLVSDVIDDRLLPPVLGGDSRSASVKAGLAAIASHDPDYVLIHDAARCFCPRSVVERVCSKLLSGSTAVVPTIPVTDSVRFNKIGVDRDKVELSQTPQGFNYKTISGLYDSCEGQIFTDDVSLCDQAGIAVDSVAGDITNKKITFKSDVEKVIYRTGFGYDAHRFSSDIDRPLVLMGQIIDEGRGLEGVSDADVGIHSVVDAILGALCLGSIGEHFPESDPKNKGIDSKKFLKYCRGLLDENSAEIVNIDTTIVCEEPKISKYSDSMRRTISGCLGISPSVVNIKGKTTEGMGFEGRREGISASTVVMLRLTTND